MTPLRAVGATIVGIAAALLLLHAAVPASAAACDIAAAVAGVDGPDTLRLAQPIEGTTTVHLAGIRVGDDRLAAAAQRGAPGDTAVAALSALVRDASVCLTFGETRQDRYGRLLAQVHRDDGLWLQGELLRRGLARVEPTPDARTLTAPMLAIEAQARSQGAGLWARDAFRVRPASDAEPAVGSFALIEGRVEDAARRQDRWYLNFGADWRSDFTVVIPKSALPDFAAASIAPYALKGRMIRVRGWVERENGPKIEVLLPEQIEITDPPAE